MQNSENQRLTRGDMATKVSGVTRLTIRILKDALFELSNWKQLICLLTIED